MSGTVNNGRLVHVDLPDFVGEVRLLEAAGRRLFSYRANRNGTTEPGNTILVEGEDCKVLTAEQSRVAYGMINLTFEPIPPSGT